MTNFSIVPMDDFDMVLGRYFVKEYNVVPVRGIPLKQVIDEVVIFYMNQ